MPVINQQLKLSDSALPKTYRHVNNSVVDDKRTVEEKQVDATKN